MSCGTPNHKASPNIQKYTVAEHGWYMVYTLQTCSFVGFTTSCFVDYKPLYQVHNYIALNPLYRVQAIPKIAGIVILQVGLKKWRLPDKILSRVHQVHHSTGDKLGY